MIIPIVPHPDVNRRINSALRFAVEGAYRASSIVLHVGDYDYEVVTDDGWWGVSLVVPDPDLPPLYIATGQYRDGAFRVDPR